ncbi:coproporphyrinogen III oxidase [Poseidonibacter lekithochrous]|uniref:coproporphyrinogen III oxidase n=1 Tax=Poseidonibacter TaxID=2321187 RepID=UPI001C099D15|nr:MULTISPECIES: coproporphyrinogen III oxidase [Poseidonibacter]MBU3015058.1 coproporphyrinogen III oxidase [Poseidonibacter lekithochrous]MDO6828355.1 coproporphyrinogen III oxidase [Poseidonibacter sp. 1_MG-2023]
MTMIMAKSTEAIQAYKLVRALQKRFVDKLNHLSQTIGENKNYEKVTWLRDEGIHGGGSRFEARDNTLFNTASVNVSQVHYDEDESKRLQSASAISTIIHPKNPNVPSIHIHISLTQIKGNDSYWRIMADLNPSIENNEDKEVFEKALKTLSKDTFEEGIKQGDKYFNIPDLNRHRGISHFYLENYKTSDIKKDYNFANSFGEGIIDTYIDIISNAFNTRKTVLEEDKKKQLDYHTLYLFQVLTLDRGTTSGLLIHNQNDVGIMGSLPTFVNKVLLKSWQEKATKPQDELVSNLVEVIGDEGKVDKITKEKLAQVVREHYKKYPQALSMQASGNTVPSTVSNHKG